MRTWVSPTIGDGWWSFLASNILDDLYAGRLEPPHNEECDPKDTNGVADVKTTNTFKGLQFWVAADTGKHTFDVQDSRDEGLRPRRSWHAQEHIDGHKVSKALKKAQRTEIITAVREANRRGLKLTVFLTFKPPTDHLSPVERMRLWETYVQRIRSHCSWRKFPCAFVMVRESDPDTNLGEHAHFLVHCPPDEIALLLRVAAGWGENADARVVRRGRVTVNGKVHTASTYITKACPQAAHKNPTVSYRLSGYLVGPRYKITRNLQPRLRRTSTKANPNLDRSLLKIEESKINGLAAE
jgi:hypothetical protein